MLQKMLIYGQSVMQSSAERSVVIFWHGVHQRAHQVQIG